MNKITIKCYCGQPMIKKGYGQYPYDCIAKRRYPNAMVYVGCTAGHTCWKHDPTDNKPLDTLVNWSFDPTDCQEQEKEG